MKRGLGILAGVTIALLVIGCSEPYDVRLRTTLDNKKYQLTLDKNLEKAPDGSNLKTADIYVRPPLGFKGPVELGIIAVEPGKYDIADSFIDSGKQAGLHILARVNKPKAATNKKGADPTKGEPAALRGDFTADVLDLVKSAYSVDVDAARLKTESKAHGARNNAFKTTTLDANTKEVQVWIYGDKASPAQVALIFDYPKDKDARNSLTSGINYCLQSFGVGRVAESLYSGGEEGAGEEAAPPPSGVF
jgi:hypothetical protein